jgi:hypothetical protein
MNKETLIYNVTKCVGSTVAGLCLLGLAWWDLVHSGTLNAMSVGLATAGAGLVAGRLEFAKDLAK